MVERRLDLIARADWIVDMGPEGGSNSGTVIFTKHYSDPDAPYDGYVEDEDTEEKARTVRLEKKND